MDPVTGTVLGATAAAGAGGAGAAAGAGAGAGILGTGLTLGSIMKVAPLIMGVGSLLTKDKTMKDLLGVGSLVAGGANLLGGLGGGAAAGGSGGTSAGVVAEAARSPMTGAPVAPGLASMTPNPAAMAGKGLRLSDLAAMSMMTGALGGRQQQQPPMAQPAPAPPMPQQPKPMAGGYTPTALQFLRNYNG